MELAPDFAAPAPVVRPQDPLPPDGVGDDYAGAIEAAGASCEYTIAYTNETTGAFVGYEFVDGALDGRRGSFVLEQRGSFGADGVIECSCSVLSGSATGELAGLIGTGTFTAREGQPATPYSLAYALPD